MNVRRAIANTIVTLATIGAAAGFAGTAQAATPSPAGAVAVGAPTAPSSGLTPAAPPRGLGGLDLSGYCRSIGHNGVYLAADNAYSWRCFDASYWYGINMQAACQWQYGNAAAQATYTDFANPRSWYCFIPGNIGQHPASGY